MPEPQKAVDASPNTRSFWIQGALVLVLLAVTAGSAAAGEPRLSNVRICTHESPTVGYCQRDERGSTARSNALYCSFAVSGDRAGSAVAFWSYEGAAMQRVRVAYAAGTPRMQSITLATGTQQALPGGTYVCQIEAGSAQTSATRHAVGPTGPIVDVGVCSGNRARQGTNASFPVCLADESAKPIAGAGGGSVVCDAVYPNATGHEGMIALLRDGVLVGSEKIPIDGPLTQIYLERPNRSKPTPLFPGDYTCEFSVVGGKTVAKHFSVVQGAPTPTAAAVEILGELSELHMRRFDVQCGPLAFLSAIVNRDPRMIVLGAARIKGRSMLLDEALVCGPLAAFDAARPRGAPSDAVLLALSVVAHEYGHTLGLRRENVVECFAARVAWKWVRRSNLGPAASAAARKFLLDNGRRPPAYKLLPTCTLPS